MDRLSPRITRTALPAPLSRVLTSCLLAFLLTGCASTGGAPGMLDHALKALGLGDAPQPRTVALRLRTGENLNAGIGDTGAALVTRVYQLRDSDRFEQAPFKVFLDEELERIALGDDLIQVTEILLMPGQRHEVLERLPADGRYLGVVALFRAPSTSRWRLAFDTAQAVDDGVTVGLHACAMTTASPSLVTGLASDPYRLSGVHCVEPAR